MTPLALRVVAVVVAATAMAVGASWLRGRRDRARIASSEPEATNAGLAGGDRVVRVGGASHGAPQPLDLGAGDAVAVASLTRRVRSGEFGVRADALVRLRTLGPRAAPAAAAIVEALREGDPRLDALVALALAALGPDALGAVEDALASDDLRVRAGVLRALERFDHLSPRAIAALRRGLVDPEETVRAAAVVAWAGHPGHASRETVEDLAARLDDASPRVRAAAAATLGRLALAPDVAVPAITRLLTRAGEPDATRLEAVWAVARIRAASPEASAALADAIRDGSPVVAREARRALRILGPAGADAADTLVAAAVAADGASRAALVEVLAAIAPGRADVVPLLLGSVRSGDAAAASAVGGLVRAGDAGVRALRDAVADPAVRTVLGGVTVDGAGGDDGAGTRAALEPLLTDPSDDLSDLALRALASAGGDAAGSVAAVVAAMQRASPSRHVSFAQTLGEIGEGSTAAATALLAVARDGDAEARAAAVRGLGYVGVADAEIEAYLRAAAASGDPAAAKEARRALSRLNVPLPQPAAAEARSGLPAEASSPAR